MPDILFAKWMKLVQQEVEQYLLDILPDETKSPVKLHQAMRYVMLNGGKRVRPLLVFATGHMLGAPHEELILAACAVELIHTYSLVHDDLPCMDDDVLRRGKETCHVKFDEATALLVGDALQSMAFALLSNISESSNAARQLQMLNILAQSSGYAGMVGGQAIDLASVAQQINIAELEYMHCLKTGALINASIKLGALCSRQLNQDEHQNLEHFAKRIGLAFQVVDDILDYESDSVTLGKTAGKDAANDKPTYVSLLGLKASKDLAQELYQNACDALSGFGQKKQHLVNLAKYIVARSF